MGTPSLTFLESFLVRKHCCVTQDASDTSEFKIPIKRVLESDALKMNKFGWFGKFYLVVLIDSDSSHS